MEFVYPDNSFIVSLDSMLRDAVQELDDQNYCQAACLIGQCLEILTRVDDERQEAEKNCQGNA